MPSLSCGPTASRVHERTNGTMPSGFSYQRWRECTIYAPLVTVGINHENRGFASRSRIPSCRQCCPNPSRSNRIVDVQTPFRQSSHQALGCGKFQHGFARHVSLTQGDSHSLPAIGRGQLRLAQEFPIKFETIDLDSAAAAGCLKHVRPLACRQQYITPGIGGLFRRPQSPIRANRIT